MINSIRIIPKALLILVFGVISVLQAQDTDMDGIPDTTDPAPTVNAVVADPDGANNLPPSLATNLIGKWDCEQMITVGSYQGFADLAGGDQPVECRSMTMSVDNSGMISKAALFDQDSDHLSAPPSLVSGRTAFSVSMWFRLQDGSIQTKATSIHTIFFAYNNSLDAYPEFFLSIYKGVAGSPNQKIYFNRYVGTSVNTDWYADIPAAARVDDTRWHHLSLVKNGSNYRLFLDGEKIKDTGGTSGSWTSTSTGYFCFGKLIPNAINAGHTLKGSLDRLRFYSRNLTDSEVIALYQQDSDRDGFWDITEVDLSEYLYLSPYRNAGPNADSDGDFLLDAWETLYGLDPLDASGSNGQSGDFDNDGVSNFDEFQNQTNPLMSDSDGDGASDYIELSQASNPNNNNDGGLPPQDIVESVNFTIGGDYTTWKMKVQGLGPRDTRTIYVTSKNFNNFEAQSVKLLKQNKYEVSLDYLRTDPQHTGTDGTEQWYCWEAKIEANPALPTFNVLPDNQIGTRNNDGKYFTVKNHWIVDNLDGLLTSHLHSKGVNHALGKKALLLPVEFEVKHTEINPATNQVVNPGADTMLRDEIADIRIKVPPMGNADWTVDLSVEPEAMRTQSLPDRGDVQMYDFGQIEENGTVTPDKTQFVLKATDGGERTIRAVFNKEGTLKIKMKSTDGKIDFTSPEYPIQTRIRKYSIPYPGFPNYDPNKYDHEFVAAADHWGIFYNRPVDTVDRIKAIAVAESNVGALVQNQNLRPHDILTVGHPDDAVLAKIQGTQDQWDLDLTHPKKPAADARYRKLNYPQANIGNSEEAIKWGVLWLYVKAFALPVNIEANPNWTYAKRNQPLYTVIDGIEEPEYRFKDWSSWDYATEKYNGGGVGDYMNRVNSALQKGVHWNAGGNNKLWPIRSNKSGRP